jgi:CHAT domain-containing protein
MSRYHYPTVITLLLAAIVSIGCTARGNSRTVGTLLSPPPDSPELAEVRSKVYGHVVRGEFEAAIPLYEQAIQLARSQRNPELAIQFTNNLAGCLHAKYAYREAVHHYREARKQAIEIGSKTQQSLATLNLATLYLDSGEEDAARELIANIALDRKNFVAATRLDSYLQLVNIYTRLKDDAGLETAFQYALAEADQEPPIELSRQYQTKLAKWPESLRELRRAWAFATISQALTKRDKEELATEYAFEAFRIRSTYGEKARLRDALQLAMLLRDAKDLDGAASLLKVAKDLDPANRTPMHLFLLDREEARIGIARGNFGEALGPLRSALARARSWRMEVLPTDSAFLNFEAYLSGEIHSSFLRAILENDFPLQQAGVAKESFWVAEEARFASMRAAQFPAAQFTERLPSQYWSKLDRFHKLQAGAFAGKSISRSELATIEQQLNELELEVGLRIPHAGDDAAPAFEEWRRQLPRGEAVFSYYLADPYSVAWIVTSDKIEVRRIASKTKLKALVEQFRREIMDPSQNGISSAGMELSGQLFGEYIALLRTIPFWTMVLDQELSSLPIAALPVNGPGSKYLVEEHSLRVVPSAIFISKSPEQSWTGRIMGVGDAVYNSADPRVVPLQSAALSTLQLNRLPGSASELRNSLQVFKSNHWATTEVTSLAANEAAIRAGLTDSPDIIHFSTHFVANSAHPNQIHIGLSPASNSTGNTLLGSMDLNSIRTRTKLVVLSGCNSSSGEMIPGIAINGLSRAFLIAGAGTVVSTLWPTLDNDGPIFPAFYSDLIQRKWSSRSAAEALRSAQLKMIRQGGWTAKPAYWAAYLAISKG